MELIFGTGNQAKVAFMKERLAGLGVQVKGFTELGISLPDIPESGKSPLENARQKALYYYRKLRRPVFSADSGLYFRIPGGQFPEELQPGVHVRRVGGKYLSDEEMIEYYGGLAQRYGRLTARYYNGICLVLDESRIYGRMDESLASGPFWLVDTPHPVRRQGFPLDSLSVNMETGTYYYDTAPEKLEELATEDGYAAFFRDVLEKNAALPH